MVELAPLIKKIATFTKYAVLGERGESITAKTAAPKSVWFHGTSLKNLQSIMSQGLIPEGTEKVWAQDPDASITAPSRQSYGGTYVTQNLMTATGAPNTEDKKARGGVLVVIMELQPNTMYLDEDNVTSVLGNPIKHLSDNTFHVLCYYLAATQDGTAETWQQEIEGMKGDYIHGCLRRWENEFTKRNIPFHADLKKQLEQLLPSVWLAAVTRAAGHVKDNYSYIRAWDQVFYGTPKEKQRPEMNTVLPEASEGEAEFRAAAEKITRTLRIIARPTNDKDQTYNINTARVTEPIGYSGSNRILALVEIRDRQTPAQMILHWGVVPQVFWDQWNTKFGSKFEVIDARKGQPKAQGATAAAKLATIIPNGTKVDIVSPDSWDNEGWGIVTSFDGDQYHVAMYGDENTQPIFDRSELKVFRGKKAAFEKFAAMNSISQQDAIDRKMFGPVYHGTTEERQEQIGNEGFKVYIGDAGSGDVSHGYEGNQPYHDGIPAPVHHLGYGIYFTTSKTIAKQFAGGTAKGMKTYYLDVPNTETINFGVPKTMMKWWISQGYDPQLAKKDRVAATKKLTENLKSKYDAVWFKGRGMYKLLDGDQICVFDPSRVYQVDPALAKAGDVGSKVKRLADGMKGVIVSSRAIPQDVADQYWGGETRVYSVKWTKGGTDNNVKGSTIEFLGVPKAQGATASFGDLKIAASIPKGMSFKEAMGAKRKYRGGQGRPVPKELTGDCWITPDGRWIDCEGVGSDHETMAVKLGFRSNDPSREAIEAGFVRVVVNVEAFGIPQPSAFLMFKDASDAFRRAGEIIRRVPVAIEIIGIEAGRGNFSEYPLAEAEEKFPSGTFKTASLCCVACESGECLKHDGTLKTAEGFNDEGFWAGEGNAASGVLPICTTTHRICLAWRSPDVHIGDCWGTIGGVVKPGLSLANSAKAELEEETGFTGGITMQSAYVFSSGSFSYHNFLGTVGSEFGFNPQSGAVWETTALDWFTLDEIREAMKTKPDEFHPGVIALFKNSGKKIEQLVGGDKPKGPKSATGVMPVTPVSPIPQDLPRKKHEPKPEPPKEKEDGGIDVYASNDYAQ